MSNYQNAPFLDTSTTTTTSKLSRNAGSACFRTPGKGERTGETNQFTAGFSPGAGQLLSLPDTQYHHWTLLCTTCYICVSVAILPSQAHHSMADLMEEKNDPYPCSAVVAVILAPLQGRAPQFFPRACPPGCLAQKGFPLQLPPVSEPTVSLLPTCYQSQVWTSDVPHGEFLSADFRIVSCPFLRSSESAREGLKQVKLRREGTGDRLTATFPGASAHSPGPSAAVGPVHWGLFGLGLPWNHKNVPVTFFPGVVPACLAPI